MPRTDKLMGSITVVVTIVTVVDLALLVAAFTYYEPLRTLILRAFGI